MVIQKEHNESSLKAIDKGQNLFEIDVKNN